VLRTIVSHLWWPIDLGLPLRPGTSIRCRRLMGFFRTRRTGTDVLGPARMASGRGRWQSVVRRRGKPKRGAGSPGLMAVVLRRWLTMIVGRLAIDLLRGRWLRRVIRIA
jgi:hypothetical protein